MGKKVWSGERKKKKKKKKEEEEERKNTSENNGIPSSAWRTQSVWRTQSAWGTQHGHTNVPKIVLKKQSCPKVML